MRHTCRYAILVFVALTVACTNAPTEVQPDTIIGMEQRALERWGKGDPDGYFEIMASDVTYFDPTTDKRVDGREQLKALIAPLTGKISIERTEFVKPTVQRAGDVAVLTFNLVSHGAQFNGGPKKDVYWNSTEIYRRVAGQWKIIHSHWSYTKPVLEQAGELPSIK